VAQISWIVVADSSRARVFAAEGQEGQLAEIADLVNPQGRSSDAELASYAPGEGRPGPRTATQEDSVSEYSTDLFSKRVARFLEMARSGHRYDRLYVIAAPEFLGRLRQDLAPEVRELVAADLDKDISWFDARDIERYVRKSQARAGRGL
jgi:protein required for attachment to host cells